MYASTREATRGRDTEEAKHTVEARGQILPNSLMTVGIGRDNKQLYKRESMASSD